MSPAKPIRVSFPPGHTVGIAYAKLFGPKMAQTPEGHPILISSGPFDNTLMTPVQAIANAAAKWMGIVPHLPNWQLEMQEDVITLPGQPTVPYTKLYHFKYLPEQELWQHKGLDDTKVKNHFKESHYLTRKWQRRGTAIDHALATTLIPAAHSAAPTTEDKKS